MTEERAGRRDVSTDFDAGTFDPLRREFSGP